MDLNKFRLQIDEIDSKLTELFCARMEISNCVGEYKKKNNLPVLDEERENEKIEAVKSQCPNKYKEAAAELYREILRLSREVQKKKCGLLGRTLIHSYSPQIHSKLSDYEYKLYEKEESELEDFLKKGLWEGLNVTIPYKKDVLKFCDELSPRAEKIGSVNTLVKRADGSIYGDNTDAFGFELLVKKLGIDPSGKKAIILGSGGACAAVKVVLDELGANNIIVISRSGENNYDNLSRNFDAEIIVNTTPLGTYPDNGKAAVDLRPFKNCKAVFDLVYNPARTALIMQAEQLNIPCISGLYMLVGQAKRSAELFSGRDIADCRISEISSELLDTMENIILIGMPGSGKSTIGKLLSEKIGRSFFDCDSLIEERIGMPVPEFFALMGEEEFRRIETEVLADISKLSGTVISTGGGAVTREINYNFMHQNSRIVWIKRDTGLLPDEGRPISKSRDITELYAERVSLYEKFADCSIENNAKPEDAVNRILEALT